VTAEAGAPEPRIHGVQYAEGSEKARRLGVIALTVLIESTGVPFREVTFDAGGHEVPADAVRGTPPDPEYPPS
jgi:hypothetical protein